MEESLAVSEKHTLPAFTMTPRSLDEALKYAEMMSNSDLVPAGYKGKPGNILVAIQKGLEVGLSPMAALETIAVINGRASLWGDGMLALVQAHPAYEAIDEGQSTDKEGVCRVKRKGEPWYEVRFTLEDAKRAGLLGKAGPWTQYQKRMLQLRARGFALRDKFADALKGMIAAEEAMDTVTLHAEVTDAPTLPAPTLKEKLAVQVQEKEEAPELLPTDPPIEPPSDLDILAADFRSRLSTAQDVRTLSVIGNEFEANPDLSAPQKSGLRILLKGKMAEMGKKK